MEGNSLITEKEVELYTVDGLSFEQEEKETPAETRVQVVPGTEPSVAQI